MSDEITEEVLPAPINMNGMEDFFKIAKQLMRINPFYGFFLAGINKEILEKGHPKYDKITTTSLGRDSNVVGYKLYINKEYWNSISNEAKINNLRHEIEHIVYNHPTMLGSYANKIIFNIAADLVVNQNIKQLSEETMSMEDYIKFCQTNSDAIKAGTMSPPFRQTRLEDFGFTKAEDLNQGTKYYYDRLREIIEDGSDDSNGAQNAKALVKGLENGNPGEGGHGSWGDFEQMSEIEKGLMDQQTQAQVKSIMDNNKLQGDLPAHLKHLIDKMLEVLPPVFNWKSALRRMVSSSCKYKTKTSRRKLNKRIEEFSAIKMKPKHRLFVGLDTSGSMSDKDIQMCFNEIDHIWKSGVAVDVGECDAALDRKKDVYEYDGKYPTSRGGVSGRGGTSVQPLIDYVNDKKGHYSCFIYLTDGYMSPPKTIAKKPMITVLVPTGTNANTLEETKGFGRVIKMNHGREPI